VLTGREERLDAGFALLAAGLGARLLVSGVGEGADHVQLARVRAGDPALYDARVELDEASASTAENASAAAAWADAQDARRLLVVSSAWHLPRGLALLARAAPEATLIPAPAPASWPWLGLPAEWAKYLWTRLAALAERTQPVLL
jgi:uncharacterized SAM-binding protein YcdF (DUF218 family)